MTYVHFRILKRKTSDIALKVTKKKRKKSIDLLEDVDYSHPNTITLLIFYLDHHH